MNSDQEIKALGQEMKEMNQALKEYIKMIKIHRLRFQLNQTEESAK